MVEVSLVRMQVRRGCDVFVKECRFLVVHVLLLVLQNCWSAERTSYLGLPNHIADSCRQRFDSAVLDIQYAVICGQFDCASIQGACYKLWSLCKH